MLRPHTPSRARRRGVACGPIPTPSCRAAPAAGRPAHRPPTGRSCRVVFAQLPDQFVKVHAGSLPVRRPSSIVRHAQRRRARWPCPAGAGRYPPARWGKEDGRHGANVDKIGWGRAAFVVVAAVALANAGCLVAAVGTASPGPPAEAGYLYSTAPLHARLPGLLRRHDGGREGRVLADLQFPLVKEQPLGGGTSVESRRQVTGDGVSVQVTLDLLTVPCRPTAPRDGRQLGRVGHFGDEAISTRIRDSRIARHVPPPPPPLAQPRPRRRRPRRRRLRWPRRG